MLKKTFPVNKNGSNTVDSASQTDKIGGNGLHIGILLSLVREEKGIPIERLEKKLQIDRKEIISRQKKAVWYVSEFTKYVEALKVSADDLLSIFPRHPVIGSPEKPIGSIIKRARISLQLSHHKFGDNLGTNPYKVRNLERATALPLDILYRIALSLGTSVTELLNDQKKIKTIGTEQNPIGRKIKFSRETSGITVEESSRKLGLTYFEYRLFERSTCLSERLFAKIASVLKMSETKILSLKPPGEEEWVFLPNGHLGLKIRHVRESKKWSAYKLASVAKYKVHYISELEKRDRIKKSDLESIAHAMEISIKTIVEAPEDDLSSLIGSIERPIGLQFKAVRRFHQRTTHNMAKILCMDHAKYLNFENSQVQISRRLLDTLTRKLKLPNSYILDISYPEVDKVRKYFS
ncbi:MAG: helix-turn-helix transcriptional regulator [Puia sp.]|nr:helix-turn-helix transcriptional regulator [Puia sp.]